MSKNFVGLLLNSFSDIIFELQKYYITHYSLKALIKQPQDCSAS